MPLVVAGILTWSPAVLGAQRLEVAEMSATKGPPEAPFGSVAGAIEVRDGEIWVSDGMIARIVAVRSQGRGFRRVARGGRGPGEVNTPTLFSATPAGGVGVYDVGHSSVLLFDSTGRFERQVRVAKVINPKGFAILPNGDLVLSGGVPGRDRSLHRFSTEGRPIGSWHPVPDDPDAVAAVTAAGGALAANARGELYFSQAAPHLIIRYATDGTPTVLARDRDLLQPIAGNFAVREPGRISYRWWFPQSRAVLLLPDGRFLNVARFRDDGYSVWDLHARDGRRLSRTRISRAYEPWGWTRDGHILASYEDPDTRESVLVQLRVRIPPATPATRR